MDGFMAKTDEGTNSTLTTAQAWKRFVSGDNAAFKYVFKHYYTSLYGYGVKLSGNPELVKDCLQEIFRDLWERRDELGHIETPKVYLFVSLRRNILKKIKQDRLSDRDLEEIDDQLPIQFGKEELIIEDEVKIQQRKQLRDALNQLPDRQKEIVFLHFYNGMSYGEIEEILSINRQSVRNHMYRAMETLRTLLNTEIMKLVVSFLLALLHFT